MTVLEAKSEMRRAGKVLASTYPLPALQPVYDAWFLSVTMVLFVLTGLLLNQ